MSRNLKAPGTPNASDEAAATCPLFHPAAAVLKAGRYGFGSHLTIHELPARTPCNAAKTIGNNTTGTRTQALTHGLSTRTGRFR